MSNGNESPKSGTDGQIELRDSRTGATYKAGVRTEGPEGDTYLRAMDLRPIRTSPEEFGLLS